MSIKSKINNDFITTCLEVAKEGSFSLALPIDKRWDIPLPSNLVNQKQFILTITGWAYENLVINKDTITIKTSFNKGIETSATFKWTEVLGVLTKDLEPLLFRQFTYNEASIYNEL